MKKTNNSPTKRIAASAMMLAVSAAMLGTSTYAWFTMNKEVTVTGMQMRTTVGSNLLISTTPDDTTFVKSITQSRAALLEPVSTINGLNYFYTVNAGADGDALADVYTEYDESNTTVTSGDTAEAWAHKTGVDSTFNTTYGLTASATPSETFKNAYGYVDYNFYLKATNTETTSKTLDLTKCNLLYNNGVPSDKAWRAAMFVDKIGTSVATGTAPESMSGTDGLKTILAPTGSKNQSNKSGSGTVQGVKDGTTLDTITLQGTAATVDNMTSGETAYYYVVVRVWLEGEDTTCTSQTYATLTGNYSLDLEFALAGGEGGTKTPVSAIGSVAAASTTTDVEITVSGAPAGDSLTLVKTTTGSGTTWAIKSGSTLTFTDGTYTFNGGTARNNLTDFTSDVEAYTGTATPTVTYTAN